MLGGVVGLLLTLVKVFHRRHSPFGPHLCLGAAPRGGLPVQLAAAYGAVVNGLVSLVLALTASGRPPDVRRERLARMLRWLTAGESHGPALVAVLEGLPAGVQVTTARHRRTPWPAAGSATAAAPG